MRNTVKRHALERISRSLVVLLFLTSCVQLCFAASNPSLASASPTPSTYSLMDSSPTSTTPFLPSPSAGTSQLELGVRVSTSAPGTITAVRYYQDSQDGAQYVAHIWDSNRNLIATQAFETSTTIGWHEVQLSNPVLIAANSTFVVSVFSTAYNYTGSHFPTTTSGPLAVQAGVYAYSSSSTYPSTDSADGYNYLVDFVFDQSSTTIPCSVSGSYQVVGTHVIFDNNYNHSCTGSVTIPATITSIDNDAFSYDPGLTSVSFEPGSAITSIGREAFYDDQAITDVSLPQGLQVIGENAFGYNSQLSSLTIPDSVISIGNVAFSYLNNVETVTIPSGITTFSGIPFNGTPLQSVTYCGSDADVLSYFSTFTPKSFSKADLESACNQQTITFTSTPPTNAYVGGPNYQVSATGGGSGNAVTFSSANPSVCSVSGTSVSFLAVDTCTIYADQAAHLNYLAAPEVSQSFTVGNALLPQSINFSAPADATFGDPSLSLSASASSGLPILFSSGNTSVCTVNQETVTIISAGSCSITASQAGDSTYLPATSVTQNFTIKKASQTTLSILSTAGLVGSPLTLLTSGGSGSGAVSFTLSSAGSASCSLTTPTSITASTAGSCQIASTKDSDTNYLSATAFATITIGANPQFPVIALSSSNLAATYGTAITPITVSNTGGAISTFTVSPTLPAGLTLDPTSGTISGTPTVVSTQNNYLITATGATAGSSTANLILSIAQANQTPLAITSTSGVIGVPLSLTTSGGSGSGAETFTVTNAGTANCTITSPSTLLFTSIGTCQVSATKLGDANYLPTTSGIATVTVSANSNTPIFSYPASTLTATYGVAIAPLTVTSTGGAISNYSVSPALPAGLTINATNGSISGTPTVVSAPASYTITASGAVYGTAQISITIGVNQANQSPLSITSTNGLILAALALTTSGGSGGGAVTYSVTSTGSANCSLTAPSTITATSVGTCQVTATKAADTNYLSATSPATTITFVSNPQIPLISLSAGNVSATYGAPITPIIVSNSGGAISVFSISPSLPQGLVFNSADGSISGTPAEISPLGTYLITATGTVVGSSTASLILNVNQAAQAPLLVTSISGVQGSSLSLTTTGGSGSGAISFTLQSSGDANCTLSGSSTIIATSAGSCLITATKAGDVDYLPITSNVTTLTFVTNATAQAAAAQAAATSQAVQAAVAAASQVNPPVVTPPAPAPTTPAPTEQTNSVPANSTPTTPAPSQTQPTPPQKTESKSAVKKAEAKAIAEKRANEAKKAESKIASLKKASEKALADKIAAVKKAAAKLPGKSAATSKTTSAASGLSNQKSTTTNSGSHSAINSQNSKNASRSESGSSTGKSDTASRVAAILNGSSGNNSSQSSAGSAVAQSDSSTVNGTASHGSHSSSNAFSTRVKNKGKNKAVISISGIKQGSIIKVTIKG